MLLLLYHALEAPQLQPVRFLHHQSMSEQCNTTPGLFPTKNASMGGKMGVCSLSSRSRESRCCCSCTTLWKQRSCSLSASYTSAASEYVVVSKGQRDKEIAFRKFVLKKQAFKVAKKTSTTYHDVIS